MLALVVCAEALVALAALVFAPAGALPWVVVALFVVAAATAVARSRHVRRPRVATPRGGGSRLELVDLTAPDGTRVGCLDHGTVVVTALAVRSGTPAVTTIDAEGTPEHHGARVPLTVLAEILEQEDIRLAGVDVVVRGERSAAGPAGRAYDLLVGPLPLISHRRTTVLLRFDLGRGPALADARGLDPEATARTVVAGTLRVRRALAHHGFGCRCLDAAALAGVHRTLTTEEPEHAAVLRAADVADGAAERCWSAPAAEVTEVFTLRAGRSAREPTLVSVAVGVTGAPHPPAELSDGYAVDRVVGEPGGPRRPVDRRTWAVARPEVLRLISPPAHGVGQIVGASGRGALALALAGVHLRTVVAAGDRGVCTALLLRAAATGLRLRIHTDAPAAWDRLVTAIDDPGRISVHEGPGHGDPAEVDLVVWDRAAELDDAAVDALADPGPELVPPTVLVLISTDADGGHPGFEAALDRRPDLVLDARIAGWLSVEPREGTRVQARVVSVPQEEELLHRLFVRPNGLDTLAR